MKKFTIILLLTFIFAPFIHGAESASAVLGRVAEKIRSSGSLNITYTLTANGERADGNILISSDCFQLSSPQVRSWYDGKTQWTYSSLMGEVNITEPTPEEIAQVNPFAIIKSFSTDYTASFLKSPKGFSNILLKSKKKNADITSATVTINNSTGYPYSIKLIMAGGQEFSVGIKSVKPGQPLPLSTFRYNTKEYPSVRVVDLR